MRIGVPTEVKNNENRVAMTPAAVNALTRRGHDVTVQTGAGSGSGFFDDEYSLAGARLADTAQAVWDSAELIVKVKEPTPAEYGFLRSDLTLFTYLHLAADRPLTEALVASGATAIAYETVRAVDGSLPLLAPMSEVAGRLSIVVGANALLSAAGGPGLLPGGVPGTPKAKVVVIGGGVAGEHAAANAVGLGAAVTIIDISPARLRALETRFQGQVQTRASTPFEIEQQLLDADLVIGSVLVPGAAAPKLVTDAMVSRMKSGSVLVDIAIDQGGCFEGSRPTTHDEPTFRVHESLYYCVANMPGSVPQTSTRALGNSTLPYIAAIADLGPDEAMSRDAGLAAGLNVLGGAITLESVRAAFAS